MSSSLLITPSDMFASSQAAQVARLFALKSGGRISKMKLIKLLYLAERLSIKRRARPIFFDSYFSLKHGPICSAALDKLSSANEWEGLTQSVSDREIVATGQEPKADTLSRADKKIIDDVWNEVGHMTAWQLRDWTHVNCGEYDEVEDGRKEITLAAIAREVQVGLDILQANILERRSIDRALQA